jgi:hypothetical protein
VRLSISFSVPRCSRPICGSTALDDLAVELQHQAQHAVRRRVLRAEVDVEVADLLFDQGHLEAVVAHLLEDLGAGVVDRLAIGVGLRAHGFFGGGHGVHHAFSSAFSSPGRMYSAPSQGDMKSNWRYSCTRLTGS